MSEKREEGEEKMAVINKQLEKLFSYAIALTANRTDAEDLVQETCLRFCRCFPNISRYDNLEAWLFKVLRNIWINELRRVQFTRAKERALAIHETNSRDMARLEPDRLLIKRVSQEAVREAVVRLPRKDREIIVLREFAELSYEEIAKIRGVPIGTVMSSLARARERLRKLLPGEKS
jgi:RNA polymerase sigma-70 factor, ECF subfamily